MKINQSEYNLNLINKLIIEHPDIDKSISAYTSKDIVTLAAAKVLGDVNIFLTGERKITDKQYQKIGRTIISLEASIKNNVIQREALFAQKAHYLMSMISNLRQKNLPLEKRLEDYYQIMGCVFSYGTWKEGDVILGPAATLPNYQVEKIITNPKGLQLIVLVPIPTQQAQDISSTAPIICCRGTTSDMHNLVDDVKKSIGKYSFKESQEEILSTLKIVTKKYGPVAITGHSLGGAIAQRIGTEFCDKLTSKKKSFIQSIYYYNAPGLGYKTAKEYKDKIDRLPSSSIPQVHSYEHEGDIVVAGGGAHVPAQFKTLLHESHLPLRFFKSIIKMLRAPLTSTMDAHSWKKLISDFKQTDVSMIPRPLFQRVNRKITEIHRRSLGKIVKRLLFYQIKKEKEIERNAKILSQFLVP